MERRYLTVVIAILVVSLIAALVWNAVLDIGNRGQIKDTIRETFDLVKANRAQEFVDKTKLACSMIYQDYDEKQYPRKIQDATDLYATLRGMTELVSVDLVKVLERLTCLAAVTFKGADGNEITRYMLLLKYEDREGNKSWAPLQFLTIEQDRKKRLDGLKEAADAGTVRERAKQQALQAIAGPAGLAESLVPGVLEKLKPESEAREELLQEIRQLTGKIEVPELAEQVRKAVEEAAGKGENPVPAVQGLIFSPKTRYLRFVARLRAIGNAEDPEAARAAAAAAVGMLSEKTLAAMAQKWSAVGAPYIERYGAAANELAANAPTDELKEEAKKLAEAAESAKEQAQAPQLPDMSELAGKIRSALLDGDRIRKEQFNLLAKLIRSTLMDADVRVKFARECEEAAEKPEGSPEEFAQAYAELASKPVELKSQVSDMAPGFISNESSRIYWMEFFKKSGVEINLVEVAGKVSADSLDPGDLYEAREKAVRRALQVERNRDGSTQAKMRKRIEALVGSFPEKWAGMKDREDYMVWAFPADEATGKAREGSPGLVKRQEKFLRLVVGKKVAPAITHHWYPDPESGFSKRKTRRTSEIVRVRFHLNPDAKDEPEKYDVGDFMLLQEMSPEWSVQWKLYRVCELDEYSKCREIARQEFEKRKAYFADGIAR